jgi:uncharacterized protein YaiL (DUF2058 family)
MKISALWGFTGNADLLKAESPKVKRGQVFDDVDDEYAHTLIGKGLVEEVGANGKSKSAKANESKPATPAEKKAEAERLQAEKAEAERLEAEKVEAERLLAEKAEAERLEAEEKAKKETE